jgi:hypothetical protein
MDPGWFGAGKQRWNRIKYYIKWSFPFLLYGKINYTTHGSDIYVRGRANLILGRTERKNIVRESTMAPRESNVNLEFSRPTTNRTDEKRKKRHKVGRMNFSTPISFNYLSLAGTEPVEKFD